MSRRPEATEAAEVRPPRLAYVIGTYPSLTTTFIDREIHVLRGWGVPVRVVALRRPRHPLGPGQRRLQADVRYVLPVTPVALLHSHLHFLLRRPVTYVSILVFLLTRRHPSARARWRTLLHVGEAVHAARLVQQGGAVDHVHAHFVDRAAVVAMVVSRLLGVPYSATAHANDIYVDPVLLPEKLAAAKFVATCTAYNAAHLGTVADGRHTDGAGTDDRDDDSPGPSVVCIHHGLDLRVFQPQSARAPAEPHLLSVAQLRPKKGLVHLVDACAELRRRGYVFTCEIVGEGPLREDLSARIRAHGLQDVVTLTGALPPSEVVERYARSSAFVLPCVTAADGDRDGIPNALLEAMAMELPVVSTHHSGIPEAVEHERTGLLVPPGDTAALTDAVARLLDDPDLRRRLGGRARASVLQAFDIEANGRRLLEQFVA
ncbi:glycosyltransferase [Egicoccus sp. AB-alg2]|uniref:glycosyltransferase n=1 Tax=Egicoccus sp. AB-alg2 TaxID=3242693 RepID=UPI00359E4D8B